VRREDNDAIPALVDRCLTHWWPFSCRERATSSNQIHAQRVVLERLERELTGNSGYSFWKLCNKLLDSNSPFPESINIPINEGSVVLTRPLMSPLSSTWSSHSSTRDYGSSETLSSSSWETASTTLVQIPDYKDMGDVSFGARFCQLPPVKRTSLLSLELCLMPKPNFKVDTLGIDENTDLSDKNQSSSRRSSKVKGAIPRARNRPSFFKDHRRDSGIVMGRASPCDQFLYFLEGSLVIF